MLCLIGLEVSGPMCPIFALAQEAVRGNPSLRPFVFFFPVAFSHLSSVFCCVHTAQLFIVDLD